MTLLDDKEPYSPPYNRPRIVSITADMITPEAQSLMKSEAYWDKKHPDHEAVKQKVGRMFNRS